LSPPQLAAASEVKRGHFLGSDHFPILFAIKSKPKQLPNRAPSWNFHKADWINWNKHIENIVGNSEFSDTADPHLKYQRSYYALLSANQNGNIKLRKPSNKIQAEPIKVWWNEECKRVVALSRESKKRLRP